MLLLILIAVTSFILLVTMVKHNYIGARGKKKTIPFPFRLPFLGNAHQLRFPMHKCFEEFSKTLGPIFILWIGNNPLYVVNNIAYAREMLIKQGTSLAGRRQGYIGNLYSNGSQGIITSDYGPKYRGLRSLVHTALRLYFSKCSSMETLINEECISLQEKFNVFCDKGPVDIRSKICCSIVNIMSAMFFGARYESEDDPEFHQLLIANEDILKGIELARVVESWYPLRFLPFKFLVRFKRALEWRNNTLSKKIMDHECTFDPSNLRDITDYIIHKSREPRLHNAQSFVPTKEQIQMVLADFYLAGTETTSTAIQWAILFLTIHQDVQRKVQMELDSVVGDRTYLSMTDQPQLPYFMATINEVLRSGSVSPFSIPHKVTKTITVDGFEFEEGSLVLFNLYAMHRDTKEWFNPDQFSPDRFLDAQGNCVTEDKSFLPFSAGIRTCLGKKLAMTEIFLLLGYLLRIFTFKPYNKDAEYDIEGNATSTIHPKPFKVKISKR